MPLKKEARIRDVTHPTLEKLAFSLQDSTTDAIPQFAHSQAGLCSFL